jgi:nucleotide-binding universal stress UspA family protein
MIPDIKKILYTTDLSQNARHAFGYAAALANKHDAKITILHVLEELSHSSNVRLASMLGEDKWQSIQDRNVNEVLDSIKQRLDTFCKDMKDTLTNCPFVVEDIVVKTGGPVAEILEQADSMNCDMIVMGTHGQGALADAMLGSTARRVVRRSEKPVLVIRLPEDKT